LYYITDIIGQKKIVLDLELQKPMLHQIVVASMYYTHNPDIPDKISEHITEKKVVVQAGGNCGVYVKRYAELFETVYTFEPSPILFYCLNLNVTNPNVFKF
jgi:hypothetical protein